MKKKIVKKKNLIIGILFFISLSIMIYSIYKIFIWKSENDETDRLLEHIKDVAVKENKTNEKEQVNDFDDTVEKTNPFWQYSEMNTKYIDFNELKEINKKTVGWIEVKGTNVNIPFVQTNDNKYYLTHSFDNSYNSSG